MPGEMEPDHSRNNPFPTTQWTLVERAAAEDPEDRARALAEICSLYWPPVYAYIRSKGHAPHDAEDLTQDFFADLLRRNGLARADASHGKLRSYLLTATKNHLVNAYHHAHTQKRGGKAVILPMDAAEAESRCLVQDPAGSSNPERVYEQQWAITLMESVVSTLEKRYTGKGQAALFHALKPCISVNRSPSSVPEALLQELGMNENALRVAAHRLRQRYADLLRQTVKSTLGHGADVEEEIRHLMTVFQ